MLWIYHTKKNKDALDLAFMFHGSTYGCTSMGWVCTPIMPRYGMYMAGTLYGYNGDVDVTQKMNNWIRYVAYCEIPGHHSCTHVFLHLKFHIFELFHFFMGSTSYGSMKRLFSCVSKL